tara:strand:- start:30 stop:617 length:588 start_codon:yes stop_codon:yes gene_type:complete
MALTFNGTNNTIGGLAVGGLPDGIVDTDMLAADAVTQPKIATKTFTSYAVIGDVKSNDVDGGTFTSGDWRTRDLNTELIDADGIVSISSNQFTLQAGSYFIEAQAMAYRVNRHMVKLYQTSGTPADIAFGTSMYANSGYNGNNVSVVKARVTISTATTYEIRHRGDTNHSTYGFGLGANFGNTELYTVVKIFKEA